MNYRELLHILNKMESGGIHIDQMTLPEDFVQKLQDETGVVTMDEEGRPTLAIMLAGGIVMIRSRRDQNVRFVA